VIDGTLWMGECVAAPLIFLYLFCCSTCIAGLGFGELRLILAGMAAVALDPLWWDYPGRGRILGFPRNDRLV
jgi:hypothetical protein